LCKIYPPPETIFKFVTLFQLILFIFLFTNIYYSIGGVRLESGKKRRWQSSWRTRTWLLPACPPLRRYTRQHSWHQSTNKILILKKVLCIKIPTLLEM
jgi:hypothetical protein